MLYFDGQQLSTGPNRTRLDRKRWKLHLTRSHPKIPASKFVINTRAAFRSLMMNCPGRISSAAMLRNFSKLISDMNPFDKFSLFRSMFIHLFFLFSSSFVSCLSAQLEACAGVCTRFVFCLRKRHTSLFLLYHCQAESTWFTKIQPLSPLYPPKPSPLSTCVDTVTAVAATVAYYSENNGIQRIVLDLILYVTY